MSSPVNPYGFVPMDPIKWFQVSLLVVAAVLLIVSLPFDGGRQSSAQHLCAIGAPILTIVAGAISWFRARAAQ